MNRTLIYIAFSCLVLIFACSKSKNVNSNLSNSSNSQLFERILPAHSGVDFRNDLEENLENGNNILDFDYFFNGSGVGIGDFDNDGNKDIVFAANQEANKIYRNLGDFKFEDRTEQSGINKGKFWSNGVSVFDINQDGLEDIYISQGGPHGPENRKNLLFINKGNFEFEERAEQYNLADDGISSQGVFFDYDKDGDLDCFVLNESPLLGFDPIRFYKLLSNHKASLWASSTSKLYRNDSGNFNDVTDDTDISSPSFGLGVCVSDINEDGWLDIYVANDYYVPDAIYINDQNGGFEDKTKEITNQISFFGMGVDIEDINNDSHKDIYVLDMASDDHIRAKTLMESMDLENFKLLTEHFQFPFQYMYNSLQLSNGNGQFDNSAQAMGLANSDWSWAGLIADYDLDGDKDIFVTNGYRRYAKDNDFRMKVSELKRKYQDVPLEEKQKVYDEMPTEKLPNVFYENIGNGQFNSSSKNFGLHEPTFSNGAAYADLDNDGDLDIVINNIDQEAFIYKNQTLETTNRNFVKIVPPKNVEGSFVSATTTTSENVQHAESKRVKGYLSSCTDEMVIGLGAKNKADKINIAWSDGSSQLLTDIKANQVIKITKAGNIKAANNLNTEPALFTELEPKSLGLVFEHKENEYDDFAKEVLLPYKQSTLGPMITTGRLDRDKNTDMYISGALGQAGKLFLSQSDGTFRSKKIDGQNADFEEMKTCFIDINSDGNKDLYIPSGGNALSEEENYIDQMFINTGSDYGSLTNQLAEDQFSGKIAVNIDFDDDGDEDLFIGNRMKIQSYPIPGNSYFFENQNGAFIDITDRVFETSNFGLINDAIKTDFNNDGNDDLIIVSEWNEIQFWENQESKFVNNTDNLLSEELIGWWFSITQVDVNSDGRQDYVVGNLGVNTKYKASKDKPLTVYANDFDDNGSLDIVLSKKYEDKDVPLRGRECSSEQMPFISEKYKSYSSFAGATIQDIYGDKLNHSETKSCNEFRSIVLVQNSKGSFTINYMPFEAQLRPILDGISLDLNKDGFLDFVAVGNIYNTEPETPRLDYHTATVLLSNQKDNFIYSQELSNEILLNDNSKSIGLLKRENQNDLIVISINNGKMKVFEVRN